MSVPSGRGSGVEELIPTTLGVALIEGYENLEFETSLSKPFLRKDVRCSRDPTFPVLS